RFLWIEAPHGHDELKQCLLYSKGGISPMAISSFFVRLVGVACLGILLLSCTLMSIAFHRHAIPEFTWFIPLNEQIKLLIHNGRCPDCPPQFRSECFTIIRQHDAFYIDYETSVADNVLISIPTP